MVVFFCIPIGFATSIQLFSGLPHDELDTSIPWSVDLPKVNIMNVPVMSLHVFQKGRHIIVIVHFFLFHIVIVLFGYCKPPEVKHPRTSIKWSVRFPPFPRGLLGMDDGQTPRWLLKPVSVMDGQSPAIILQISNRWGIFPFTSQASSDF